MRIYLDLEYIYPGMTKESGRPTASQKRQVVQIAAILFDNEKNQEVSNFEILTCPAYTKELPIFFTELTQITQKELDERGVPFITGLQNLVNFTANYPVWTFNLDQEVLTQNCEYFKLTFPWHNEFIRVKPLLSQWGINPMQYSSGTLYQAAGLKMSGHVHNALHDVRSMAHAVHFFESKDW